MTDLRRIGGADSFFSRLSSLAGLKRAKNRASGDFLSAVEFNRLILKEQARVSRRPGVYQFVLLRVEFDPHPAGLTELDLAKMVRGIIRLLDDVSAEKSSVVVLLPETDREGAMVVSNKIRDAAIKRQFQIDIDIFCYPDDDMIASGGVDLLKEERIGRVDAPHIRTAFAGDDIHHEPAADLSGGASGFTNSDSPAAVLTKPQIVTGTKLEVTTEFARPSPKNAIRIAETASRVTFSDKTPLWKRTFDIVFSALLLIILSPFFLLAAILIKLDGKGPIFFEQLREGKDGVSFGIYKFRTMLPGAELLRNQLLHANQQDGPAFKIENDPRVTGIGRFLRKSCIDELPQLINVLRGDMSLVGPRPLPVDESRDSKTWHRERLKVLPGMTCLWQVAGDRKMSFDDWMRLDIEYIRNRSLLLDIRLIIRTAWIALRQKGNA